MLADRRRRLDIDKRDKDAAEKAERRAKAEARRESNKIAPSTAKTNQAMYAQQQRKRQAEAKLERDRILREIKSDGQARKEKEELRKQLARARADGNDGAGGLVDRQISSEVAESRPRIMKDCAVQVRILDGSTVRSKFSSEMTLSKDVRAWVDEQRRNNGDIPYTFKQILTPSPNRAITISEEEQSLQSLNFTPSVNLVIVPVQGYTAAYAGTPGLISKWLSSRHSMISTGTSMITDALGTILELGRTFQQESGPSTRMTPELTGPTAPVTGNDVNVRTLHLQREGRDDHQLHNGNQVRCPSPVRILIGSIVQPRLMQGS